MVSEGAGLKPADLMVENGRITAIGRLEPPGGMEMLDASGCAIVPGFVNAHAHSGENLNPGLFENLPLDLWFVHSHQVTKTDPPSAEEIYLRTLLGAAQMLRTGTTSVGDFLYEAPKITSESLEPVVRAYRDIGLRLTLILGLADQPYLASLPWRDSAAAAVKGEATAPDRAEIMDLVSNAIHTYHDPAGPIRIGLGPSAPQRCSPELLDQTMNMARQFDLVWHTHALETKSQACTAQDRYGRSFVHYLAARNLLGPRTSVVHAVWLDASDMDLLQSTGSNVIHCPASNLRLGDGVSPLPSLRRRQVNVALGTDGRGCDERLDMLELARLTATLHKVWGQHYTDWITADSALAMATEAGARCLGQEGMVGSLGAGAWADLLLVDLRSLTFLPLHHFRRQLTYGADSGDLRAVIVGGRIVVDRGRVLTIDEEALRREIALLTAGAVGLDEPDPAAVAIRSKVDELWRECERRQLPIRSYLGPLPEKRDEP
ncbi:MAG: amidohydrolase family protein [Candidatus Dormibacteria bacterium]